jgi:hypothetical protein
MEKIIVIIFLFWTFCNSQIVNEAFGNWYPDTAEATGFWVFDDAYHIAIGGDSVIKDLSSSNIAILTSVGTDFTTYSGVVDSLSGSSFMYNGGTMLNFAGLNQYLSAPDGSGELDDYIDAGTTSITYQIWFVYDSQYSGLAGKADYQSWEGATSVIMTRTSTSGRIQQFMNSILGTRTNNTTSTNEVNIGDNIYAAFVYEREIAERCSLYINGSYVVSADISAHSENLNSIYPFNIAYNWVGMAYPYDGYIAAIRVSKNAVSSNQVYLNQNLANGWYTKLNRVYRDGWNFYQGFYDGDTVYCPVADGGPSGTWQLSVDAKGTKSGDVLKAWIGNGIAFNQTLTTTSTIYTLDMGAVTLSGDSLYFSASASDTVYIDNVMVTDMITDYENRFPVFPEAPVFHEN